MARAPLERLTRREREIMNVLFALDNRASAEDVRARLTNSPSYSAVRTMLTRLEQKGYLIAAKTVTVAPELAGRITFLHCDEGIDVKQGDLLAQIDATVHESAMREHDVPCVLCRRHRPLRELQFAENPLLFVILSGVVFFA